MSTCQKAVAYHSTVWMFLYTPLGLGGRRVAENPSILPKRGPRDSVENRGPSLAVRVARVFDVALDGHEVVRARSLPPVPFWADRKVPFVVVIPCPMSVCSFGGSPKAKCQVHHAGRNCYTFLGFKGIRCNRSYCMGGELKTC